MTKLSILAILSLLFIGVTRIAQFVMALFVIVFFGFTTFELIRTFRQPARVLQVWRDDEGALNRTMAEIDKRLKQMRKSLGRLRAGF